MKLPRGWRRLKCTQCGGDFARIKSNIRKSSKRLFCSVRCRNDGSRTGRIYVEDNCNGCGVPVRQIRAKAVRYKNHYCSRACFRTTVDWAEMARKTAGIPRPRVKKLLWGDRLPRSSVWFAVSPRFTKRDDE